MHNNRSFQCDDEGNTSRIRFNGSRPGMILAGKTIKFSVLPLRPYPEGKKLA
jgi:hypothetical protein